MNSLVYPEILMYSRNFCSDCVRSKAFLDNNKIPYKEINILEDKLSQSSAKLLAKLQLVLVGLINLIIAWFSFNWISKTGDNLMPTLGATRSIVQISIPLGCGLATLYCITSSILGLDKIKDNDLKQTNTNFNLENKDQLI